MERRSEAGKDQLKKSIILAGKDRFICSLYAAEVDFYRKRRLDICIDLSWSIDLVKLQWVLEINRTIKFYWFYFAFFTVTMPSLIPQLQPLTKISYIWYKVNFVFWCRTHSNLPQPPANHPYTQQSHGNKKKEK